DLTARSAAWAALAANGTSTDTYGTLGLTGTDPSLDVFRISADALASANGLNLSAPAGATVLVNVPGTTAQVQSFGMTVSGTDLRHLLFNSPEAPALTVAAINFQGSVLAPRAAVTFNNGNLEGTLVAQSLSGNGEFHQFPTQAQVSAPTAAAPDVAVFK